jgi:hypothetical protein
MSERSTILARRDALARVGIMTHTQPMFTQPTKATPMSFSKPILRLANHPLRADRSAAPQDTTDDGGAGILTKIRGAFGIDSGDDDALAGILRQAQKALGKPRPADPSANPDQGDESDAQVSSDAGNAAGSGGPAFGGKMPRRDGRPAGDKYADPGTDVHDPDPHGPTTRAPAREGQDAHDPNPRRPSRK